MTAFVVIDEEAAGDQFYYTVLGPTDHMNEKHAMLELKLRMMTG